MSKEKRNAVILLLNSGLKNYSIAKRLQMSERTVQKIIKRYRDTGSVDDKPRSGRPKSACSSKNIKNIKDKIRRNPNRSMRQMAKEHKISKGSVRNIVKNNLKLHPYRIQKAQKPTEQANSSRVAKSKALITRLSNGALLNTLWTDEKLFTVEQAFNKQNNRILASSIANASDRIVERCAHPASVMVWAGVTSRFKTPLIFVEPGVKIDKHYYIDKILEAVVIPWARKTFKSKKWLFQQDGAPAHTARLTQKWFRDNLIDFISKEEWPGYSPDLNPMDFSVWGYLENKACATPHKNLNSLKASLIREWNKMPLDMLRATVEAVPTRLKACINSNGNRFEK